VNLNPRDNSLFLSFAAWLRNAEVWVITGLVLLELRALMSKRMMGLLFVPSATHDPVSDAYELPIKLVALGATLIGFPLALAAIAYNFANWPSHEVVYAAPLSHDAVVGLAGVTWGPMLADAIDVVSYFFPISFALGAVVYMGVVWLSMDTLCAGIMLRMRYLS
jgi:hypothetical protein